MAALVIGYLRECRRPNVRDSYPVQLNTSISAEVCYSRRCVLLTRGARRQLDIPGQSHSYEKPQQQIGQVDLPPVPLIAGTTRLGMVIVVPALAACQDRHQHVVAAVVTGVIVLVARHMRQ